MSVVGQSVKRKDGIGKATGRTRYADDLVFPGMLHARTIRSTIPCGRVRSVKLDFDTTGFVVCDYRDVPGRNLVALIEDDQPCLIEREPAEPVLDPLRSERALKKILIEKGDLARGFAEAELVVEGTYRTGHQEHVYIEPNGVIAVPDGEGGVTVHGSIQCPFYVDRALRVLLGEGRGVRVVQTETGGGFGGKEEFPSVIAGHAALLALKSGRPVKMIYDRAEDMLATTKP